MKKICKIIMAVLVALIITLPIDQIIYASTYKSTVVYRHKGREIDKQKTKINVPEYVLHKEAIDYDYLYVERVVMAEAGAESLECQMAIAQCIRNTAELYNMNPEEVVKQELAYTSPATIEVNDSVKEACRRIFRYDENVMDKDIMYFYSERAGFYSEWHEGLNYCFTIDDVKFFK